MPAVSILLNVLWIVFGGFWMAAGWVVAAIIMAITIIGLPWARAAFNIAAYTLLPFGQQAVRRDSLTGRTDIGTGPLGLIGNLIWLVLAGWWLALGHLATAVGSRGDHHRHSLRLGPCEAGRNSAMADRQGDRSGVAFKAWLPHVREGSTRSCPLPGHCRGWINRLNETPRTRSSAG